MADWIPFFTLDGSVGLYNTIDDDVYHSVYGAADEAYNKFILPAKFHDFFKNKNKIKILDLCYGIGYNTKLFLNYFLKISALLTENNYSIDTNNILNAINNDTIYTNNIYSKILSNFCVSKIKNYKIEIDAIDKDELLIKLSPFFIINKNYCKNNKTGIDKVDKYLKNCDKFKINTCNNLSKEVNDILLYNLLLNYNNQYLSADLMSIINDKKYAKFFRADISRYIAFYFSKVYNLSSEYIKPSFLHNIYYEYISASYKNTLKVLQNNEISIKYISDDARDFLKNKNNCYDFIFLDAFSPNKCPNLWTYEFFNLLYNNLSDNGKILTYSNSSAIRNAMLKNNFYIAKIFNEQEHKFTGTIAAKNPSLVSDNMTDFDFGLLNTKAGIMYRDKDLSATNAEILQSREIELANSNLLSTTQYKNKYKEMPNEL